MVDDLLLDANLAVLLTVGLADRKLIDQHKKLRAYSPRDFDEVTEFVALYDRLIFCPHVLAETSNLSLSITEPYRTKISNSLALIARSSTELYRSSSDASNHPQFTSLGMTDAILLTLAAEGCVLLTADAALHVAAITAGHEAYNYNHLREARIEREGE
ncbi:hypothetical protein [Devosia naphthalenivorans]|uniref:hypothetical protein n=1 Tax=Devosia naphthalenivorans TaxID=2082392 RepID=UPI000D366141|nr:hypothetical protein [Devosia naphthalenivorans]